MDLAGRILELEEQVEDLKACLTRLICVGKVVATDPAAATVRVELPGHDDLVTDFLPVLYQKTQNDKEYWMPDIGEQVLVLFVPLGGYETGFVLGASYNQVDAVPVVSQDKWHKKFKDGTYLEYDRSEHVLKGQIKGRVELVVDESLKAEIGQDASISVGGNLSAKVKGSASVGAGNSINLTAPQITLQGNVSSSGSGGSVGQEIKSANTDHTGNYTLNGNLTVNGSIFATGDILCDGSNANHHTHD